MSIEITPEIVLREQEYTIQAFHASGPGGQHVNKVATAIRLRYNVPASTLPESVKHRLMLLASNRINKAGDLTVTSRRFRTQDRNRQAAVDQLVELLMRASIKPRKRRKTRPSKASIERRLQNKRRISEKKRYRKRPGKEGS